MNKIKIGDQFRNKRNWWGKLTGHPDLVYTVVKDNGEFWFRDYKTIYPGGTGMWCGKVNEFDLSEWEKINE